MVTQSKSCQVTVHFDTKQLLSGQPADLAVIETLTSQHATRLHQLIHQINRLYQITSVSHCQMSMVTGQTVKLTVTG